jgi:hypothetical protein
MTLRVLTAMALGCFVFTIGTAAADDKKKDHEKWTPPGLSREEQAEWKNGRPPGWSHGQKKGWRGKSCPPGQAKKGRCPDGVPTSTSAVSPLPQPALDPIQAAIERIRDWARNRKIAAGTLDAMLVGFQGAVHYGVPIPAAEKFVISAADRSVPAAGIEVLTRALAYSAQRGVAPDHLQHFAENGLARGVPTDAIALGLYRMGADARR